METASPWLPLRYPIFRMLLIAAVISNIGTWMQQVGTAWLMTSLTSDPLLVALVQGAATLPIFLLALPAGALADIIDRRRYLMGLHFALMLIAGALAIVTFLNLTTPTILLSLTFALGALAALSAPTWQALIPDLVPKQILQRAIALNSGSENIAGAIGPAFAGIIIAALGTAAVFAVNALSFLAIIVALFIWKHPPEEHTLPAERFFGAMRLAVRHIYAAPALHNILIRTAIFCLFASGVWALIPLIARVELNSGSMGYGILLTFLGIGAIFATLSLPRLEKQLSNDKIIDVGYLLSAVTAALLIIFKNYYVACLAMLIGGYGWMIATTTLTTATQQASPTWIKGRTLAIFLMVLFGGIAAGSAIWGTLASHFNITTTLIITSIGLILGYLLTYRLSFKKIQKMDHTPAHDLPAPAVKIGCQEKNPVMVSIEYIVESQHTQEFTKLMRHVRAVRIRQGAFFWKLYLDTEDTTRFVEYFMSESWVDHLRLHERLSISDREIDRQVQVYNKDQQPPHISHLVEVTLPKKHA